MSKKSIIVTLIWFVLTELSLIPIYNCVKENKWIENRIFCDFQISTQKPTVPIATANDYEHHHFFILDLNF
jgi:hypothetical protein